MAVDAPSRTTSALDLRSYLDVLVRRWRVIAVVTLVCVVLAVLLSLKQDKQYEASADLLMSSNSGSSQVTDTAAAAYRDSINAARQLVNQVQQFESGTTRQKVAEAYDGPLDPDDVKASSDATSDVVKVSLTATDPEEAASLVNTYIDVFIKLQRQQRIDDLLSAGNEIQAQIDDLTKRIDSIRQPLTDVENQLAGNPTNASLVARRADLQSQLDSQLTPLQAQRSSYQQTLENLRLSANITETTGPRLLTKADVPTDPVAPKPVQNTAIAIVVGLLLGVVVAFLRDTLDERILGMNDLDRAAPDVPPLAVVPETRMPDDPSYLPVRDDPRAPIAEAFRSLRTSVKFAGLDEPLRVIQVTSALPSEGKTTVVANLAESLAQGGDRVAVVCCDLRRPRLHKAFRRPLSPGLTDVILGQATLESALAPINDRLYILPAGTAPPNPSELLSSARAAAVIHALASEFDVVLIDCTPTLPVTDALVVSRFVDATLLVVDIRTTKRRALHETVARFERVRSPLRGLVLNGVGPTGAYQYGYGYAEAYGPDTAPDAARLPDALQRAGTGS
jgi:capsular exopolysaccharide synthesis family protein